MKKRNIIFTAITLLFLIATSLSICAKETKEEKKLRKEREKIEEARIDSIDAKKAMEAIKDINFTLMADRLQTRRNSAMVSDNMNFVSVTPKKGMLQIVPFFAGFNGINLKGNVTNVRVNTTKKGDTNIIIDIFGSELRARVDILMWKGSNSARAIVTPNLSSGDITLYGKIFPTDLFPNLQNEMNR